MYDAQLRSEGLRSTQFTLLQTLDLAGALTQGELGDLLCLDSTTLTRSLSPLIDAGWVARRRGSDRRERHLQLTASGHAKLQQATPAWRRAQKRLKKAFGRGWDEVEHGLRRVAGTSL